jgi:Aspartyl protease
VQCSSKAAGISSGEKQLHFETDGHIPVVKAKLNGKPALFIIDTGASVSILNAGFATYYGFSVVEEITVQHTATGLEGAALPLGCVGKYTLEVGPLQIRSPRFQSRNLQALSSILFADERVHIAGIFGADVLMQYKMRIDFTNRTISF